MRFGMDSVTLYEGPYLFLTVETVIQSEIVERVTEQLNVDFCHAHEFFTGNKFRTVLPRPCIKFRYSTPDSGNVVFLFRWFCSGRHILWDHVHNVIFLPDLVTASH